MVAMEHSVADFPLNIAPMATIANQDFLMPWTRRLTQGSRTLVWPAGEFSGFKVHGPAGAGRSLRRLQKLESVLDATS